MDPAISAQGISKTFRLERGPRSLMKLLKAWSDGDGRQKRNFSALQEVSFTLQAAKNTALIGNNGAGKSTLLRILAGLYRQSAGTFEIKGKILYLPGFAIGMHPELSVSQNIVLHSAIYGIPRETSLRNIPDILAWAELEKFADQEFRKLSKGMQARLAFSTCRHIKADIHLLDEAESGGDQDFKAKCNQYFIKQADTSTTFLIATHNLKFARQFCTDALFLHKGRVVAFGPIADVLELYESYQTGTRRAKP